MQIRLPAKELLKPSTFSMVAVAASFCAWLLPSFGTLRKGFTLSESIDLTAILVLSSWCLLIFLSFYLGHKTKVTLIRSRPIEGNLLALDSKWVYWVFTLLSASGTFYTLAKIISSLSLSEIILFIGLSQANALKYALYSDYSVGLVSFRYLVVYSASLALYKLIRYRKASVIHIFNLFVMLLAALISSRLIFVATLTVTVFILNFDKKKLAIKFSKGAVLVVAVFIILSTFNYSRNARFYESNNLSFAGAGISEIVTYLGSPFQVAIGRSKILDKLFPDAGDTYRNYVDTSKPLTTISAFIGLHEQMGYICWLYLACMCFLMGLLLS